MQIHKLLVSVNQLDRFDDGAVLDFERDIDLLDEGDALVARLANGDEHLLIVQRAHYNFWTAVLQVGAISRIVRLELIGNRQLRLVMAAA